MKITQRRLMEMIEQEVHSWLAEFSDGKGKKKSQKKGSKKPNTAAADQDQDDEVEPAGQPNSDGGGVDPIGSNPPVDGGMNDEDDGEEPEVPDPTDGKGEDDAEAIDAQGTGGEEPSGAVNKELTGKTVQAISIEPESPNLPGAKEVVITFNETQDSLRIILSPTGLVKFGWPCGPDGKAKQLHDLP